MRISYNLDKFRGDVLGGVTTSVVAIPTALAFGVASGLGAAAGLYGAIAGGFFAAVFGGTRSQISGPTGPMAVAMAVIITTHAETLGQAFTVVIMAGLLQILLGLLRIGRFVAYTPYPVISGFMTGIGIIIWVIQIRPFLGLLSAPGGVVSALAGLAETIGEINFHAPAVAAVTLAVGALWPARLRNYIPGPLAAVIAGTALAVFWLDEQPVIGAIPVGLPAVQLPALSPGFLLSSLQPALILALLGSLDSLLTSLIADSLTGTRHNANRELVGQGIGNTAAGFIGAMPGAGATLGTVVNIRSGGNTQVSGALRSVILLGLALGLGRYVEDIPLAVLAGILMKVGWDIIDWRYVTRLHRVRREHMLVMLITLALTVFLDLVTAVAIGLIAAGMASARLLEMAEHDSVVSVPLLDRTFLGATAPASGAADGGGGNDGKADEDDDPFAARVGLVELRGRLTVASSGRLVNTITAEIRDHQVVIFDFTNTAYMDDSAAIMVEQMINAAVSENTAPIIMGLGGAVGDNLRALKALDKVPADAYAENLDAAREIARRLLAQGRGG